MNKLPTLRQLIWSTLAGLSSHPRIKKPDIFYPITEEEAEPERVYIERWKTYDGWELQEPGLTCSIYPKYSNKSSTTNTPDAQTAEFTPYELGKNGSAKGVYNLIVQLHYQDVAINNVKTIPYYVVRSPEGMLTPHGVNFLTGDSLQDKYSLREYNNKINNYVLNSYSYIEKSEIEIEINPAEEILREYLDLIRAVLDELRTILPWRIKSTRVKSYDFPTSSWSSKEENINFHLAYLEWEVTVFIPGQDELKTMNALPVEEINIINNSF